MDWTIFDNKINDVTFIWLYDVSIMFDKNEKYVCNTRLHDICIHAYCLIYTYAGSSTLPAKHAEYMTVNTFVNMASMI